MIDLNPQWDSNKLQDEQELTQKLAQIADLDVEARGQISAHATKLVEQIRAQKHPGLMEVFLAEYGLSTKEGVALMCLAEALLRVPDNFTMDALIEDKIVASDWSKHIGSSASPLVNASTWGLFLSGKILDDPNPAATLRSMLKRMGEPVIRNAVSRAMQEMGRQFVLGQDINAAMQRARKHEAEGYSYSYDMLGEAAMTAADAANYAAAYAAAIAAIATRCLSTDVRANPGISVKLSALHPRYEVAKSSRVMRELVPTLRELARSAAQANMGLNIDAEEADRLGLSLQVIEALLADPALADWPGLGFVVQAYSRRAFDVIEALNAMAERNQRRIMLRLVKGAYWDSEIKHAQVQGLTDFPVFTRKHLTDISYIACARRLLQLSDRIYPQFATHNAHSVATILHLAGSEIDQQRFEFQRLHGMGAALHALVLSQYGTRCRIYAPVGTHRDLLAYLVRRLLENGANSSFVNQVVDTKVPASKVGACPFAQLDETKPRTPLPTGPQLFAPERANSRGFDLADVEQLRAIDSQRTRPANWQVFPELSAPTQPSSRIRAAHNPATGEPIGSVYEASPEQIELALSTAQSWQAPVEQRSAALQRAAQLYEDNYAELFALLATEAGKTLADSVAELREAVDFLYYYAQQASLLTEPARGVFTCISPWNFPLAIFTGQIAAALAAGNGVLAKPAETTPAIASFAVKLLHQAGVPKTALQLLPGDGKQVGLALSSDARVDGVAFTGSTATARAIQVNMAAHMRPGTPLIAETGGLNAMIVDSSALAEQAVRDIIASSFQSAGQRCSALRCLYVQQDVLKPLTRMIIGAMDELEVGDPWRLSTDVGPVISAAAQGAINAYIDAAEQDGRLLHKLAVPEAGNFIAPTLIQISGIEVLEQEVFGPVLHIASFRSDDIELVVEAINSSGYGLTFGLQTRIDSRVQDLREQLQVGNMYVNRNQIGAVVGSQPFGGEGMSGTGPKAGGSNYLPRFTQKAAPEHLDNKHEPADLSAISAELNKHRQHHPLDPISSQQLPGPTGELNEINYYQRPPLLCLGPRAEAVRQQVLAVEQLGGRAIAVTGELQPEQLAQLPNFGGLVWWGEDTRAQAYAQALSQLPGAIIPLITDYPDRAHSIHERHLCVDTTAAGGNASLLASS